MTPTHRVDLNFDSHDDTLKSFGNGIQTFTKFSSTYFDESIMKKEISCEFTKVKSPAKVNKKQKKGEKAEKDKVQENLNVNRSPKTFIVHKDHYNK